MTDHCYSSDSDEVRQTVEDAKRNWRIGWVNTDYGCLKEIAHHDQRYPLDAEEDHVCYRAAMLIEQLMDERRGDCKFECRKWNARKEQETFIAGALFGENMYLSREGGCGLMYEDIERAYRKWKNEQG